MLSEIEKPPSTDATPRITPSDWSVERVKFSRISTQELRTRSRKAPLNITKSHVPSPKSQVLGPGLSPGTWDLGPETRSRRLLHFDQPIHDLDLSLRHGRDGEVVRDDDDRVALAVQVGEELEHLVAGLLVE